MNQIKHCICKLKVKWFSWKICDLTPGLSDGSFGWSPFLQISILILYKSSFSSSFSGSKKGRQCTTTFWFVYLERGAVQKLQMIKFNYSNYIICLIGNSYHEYPRHTYSVAWKYLQADIAKFMILIVLIVCYGIWSYLWAKDFNITWFIPIFCTWFLEILHLPPSSHSTTRFPVDAESTVLSIFSLPSAVEYLRWGGC